MYFYSDTTKAPPNPRIWEADGTKAYVSHYDNLLFLRFVAENERSTFAEKRQAEKEMLICERKLKWWERHPNYNQKEALRQIEQRKKLWAGR